MDFLAWIYSTSGTVAGGWGPIVGAVIGALGGAAAGARFAAVWRRETPAAAAPNQTAVYLQVFAVAGFAGLALASMAGIIGMWTSEPAAGVAACAAMAWPISIGAGIYAFQRRLERWGIGPSLSADELIRRYGRQAPPIDD